MFVCIWYLDGKVQANENELNTFFSVQTVKNVIEYYKHTKKINLSLGFLLTISLRDTGMHCTFGFISFVYGFSCCCCYLCRCADLICCVHSHEQRLSRIHRQVCEHVSMPVCVCVFVRVWETVAELGCDQTQRKYSTQYFDSLEAIKITQNIRKQTNNSKLKTFFSRSMTECVCVRQNKWT